MNQNTGAGVVDFGGQPGPDTNYPAEGRERGARRRKLAGYLKAANELRQTYQQTTGSAWATRGSSVQENGQNEVGGFPDVSTARFGDEEMVIFPSYARRHIKRQAVRAGGSSDQATFSESSLDNSQAPKSEDIGPLRQDGKAQDDDDAVVEVDVRGWVYSPHRGPLTRKNRLMIGLARHLSGIPAPSSSNIQNGDARDGQPAGRRQDDATTSQKEDELVSLEAESIRKKGENEVKVATRGGYSEEPSGDVDRANVHSRYSRSSTPETKFQRDLRPGDIRHSLTTASLASSQANGAEPTSIVKRLSWNQPVDMSPAELAVANSNLMARLTPFLNVAIPHAPITIFFYNDERSQSRTVITNEAGHFRVRAGLNFVPTNVRVLASENLSVTEEVHVLEPTGISLISDIDDTIKHSAIGSGAREMFRNTFVRDLSDLTIDGVKDWYQRLAEMGVQLHYVSNAPWQLYPLLVNFFALAGLPPGSFHLKQYSGMLQGIFEPVAERKKGPLESIMRDFPERKFILVGDSGEADLEVYTDVVVANPGRVIGVYIRDINTPKSQGFFDPSTSIPGSQSKVNHNSPGPGGFVSAIKSVGFVGTDQPKDSKLGGPSLARQATEPAVGKLIDLDEDEAGTVSGGIEALHSTLGNLRAGRPSGSSGKRRTSQGPVPPMKPLSLRLSISNERRSSPNEPGNANPPIKTPPAIPPKPRKYSQGSLGVGGSDNVSPSQAQSHDTHPLPHGHPTSSQESTNAQAYYGPRIRRRVTTAYNKLPSATAVLRNASTRLQSFQDVSQQASPPSLGPSSSSSSSTTTSTTPNPPAPRPSRPPGKRALTSYPTTTSSNNPPSGPIPIPMTTSYTNANRKEEIWNRRWTRAKEILDGQGVRLRAWSVGGDVIADAVALVEKVRSSSSSSIKEKGEEGGGVEEG